MPKPLLLRPEQALAVLRRRFDREQTAWLMQSGADAAARWPLTIVLGMPTERDLAADAAAVRDWVDAWARWPHHHQVQSQLRSWPRLGEQRLPATLVLNDPQEVADVLGHGPRWRRAAHRFDRLLASQPGVAGLPPRQRIFDALADFQDKDFDCLHALLGWLRDNPASGMSLRQLPVPGLHTKWIEQHRGLIVDIVAALRGMPAERDLSALLGLHIAPSRLRIRLLCPRLRAQVGGLGDIEAPLPELVALPIAPARALIVENLQTALALPDIEGCVALMKLGHAVTLVQHLRWLAPGVHTVYWSDIDTHGFAMLDRARTVMPWVRSALMGAATLQQFSHLCVAEEAPHPCDSLDRLTPAERVTLQALEQRRLEQERVPWPYALAQLLLALDS